ncbi:MAG: sigma-70 family RNA polymerase sigma factor [Thermomicrobiales bacterium]|nr:sigma-70 family RNA polymerase sigma factor [Thermomicrobiales bacterium]
MAHVQRSSSAAESGSSVDAAEPIPAAPLFLPEAPVDEAGAIWLTRQAHALRAGDPAAPEALWRSLEPRIRVWVEHCLRCYGGDRSPRRDGRPWLAEDLRQEGFPVLLAIVADWSGEGSFLPWLLTLGPRRMAGAWWALAPREEPLPLPGAPLLLPDGNADDALAVALLEGLAAAMEPLDAGLLLGHVRDGQPVTVVGARLGLSRGATTRHWNRIRAELREVLRGRMDDE